MSQLDALLALFSDLFSASVGVIWGVVFWIVSVVSGGCIILFRESGATFLYLANRFRLIHFLIVWSQVQQFPLHLRTIKERKENRISYVFIIRWSERSVVRFRFKIQLEPIVSTWVHLVWVHFSGRAARSLAFSCKCFSWLAEWLFRWLRGGSVAD